MKPLWILLGILLCLAACNPSVVKTEEPSHTPQTIINTPDLIRTKTPLKKDTPTPLSMLPIETTNFSTPQHIPTIPVTTLYNSPLQGITIAELSSIISNPFSQPQLGKDDAHHGVDFAFYQFKERGNIAGLPIQSVFSSKVAGVTHNLPPYGYMIITETDLSDKINEILGDTLPVAPSASSLISPQLTCPELSPVPENLVDQSFSLYLLYAHLSEPPLFQRGEEIQSGDTIGYVGTSGMSGNPHLHLEFRIGPSGYLFEPMGHYSNTLSEPDFKNYCIWRVSGWFIPMDPMLFFNSLNSSAN